MDRVLSLLGIAQKAGKVVSGGFLCEDAIKSREAVLVILAEDAQKNTVHTITNKCTPGACGWHNKAAWQREERGVNGNREFRCK